MTLKTFELAKMDQNSYFSSGVPSYRVPSSFYNLYGTGIGHLQHLQRKQDFFSVSKPSFSIDSLLTHRCSRETSVVDLPETLTRAPEQRDCPFQYRSEKSMQQRFRPYYYTQSANLEQESSSFDKPSTTENDRGEPAGKKDWLRLKPKRMRTIFTIEQLEKMEKEFDRQQYMVGADRYFLANELGLTETQVKVWFQNRRIKWRKSILEKQHRQLCGEMATGEEF